MAVRIDQRLVELGLARSRAQAQALIAGGHIMLARPQGVPTQATKASLRVGPDVQLSLNEQAADQPVSRAAIKFDALIEAANLPLSGTLCVDAGQSTGGFTERLLQHGAAYVIGVEVGHDQLAKRLRSDERVACVERTNIKSCTRESLAAFLAANDQPRFCDQIARLGADIISADLSFISLRKVLPALASLLAGTGHLLALVKPQFELGPGAVNKRGVITKPSLLEPLQAEFTQALSAVGLDMAHWLPSPIAGSDGNAEFLLHACRPDKSVPRSNTDFKTDP